MHRDQIRALEQRLGGNPLAPTSCDSDFAGGGDGVDQFFRLTAIAFACNLTRVVTINLDQLEPGDFGASSAVTRPRACAASGLDAVPEGSGTLLDNTMVIWITELATGPHDMADGLTIVARGGGGTLQPGRRRLWHDDRYGPGRFADRHDRSAATLVNGNTRAP